MRFEAENVPFEKLPKPAGWRILLAPVKIEEQTKGGIVIADTRMSQSKPSAGEIVSLSSQFDQARFPGGEVGKIIYFQMNAGYDFPDRWNGDEEFVLLDARAVVGCYEPIAKDNMIDDFRE